MWSGSNWLGAQCDILSKRRCMFLSACTQLMRASEVLQTKILANKSDKSKQISWPENGPSNAQRGSFANRTVQLPVQLLNLSQQHWMFCKGPYVLSGAATYRNHFPHTNIMPAADVALSTVSIRASEWPWARHHYTNVYNSFHSWWPILSKWNLTRYSKVQKPFARRPSHR